MRFRADQSENIDESALIQRAKRDPEAMAELYRAHYPKIARFVHRRVLDSAEAEDIVAEVFLTMVQRLSRYRYRGIPFQIWLYRIATSQISRWSRRRQRWARKQLENWDELSATEKQTDADAELVELALATLPGKIQTVMSLHYLEEMKVAEIAAVVGKSEGTIKSRLHDGRRMMREKLRNRLMPGAPPRVELRQAR